MTLIKRIFGYSTSPQQEPHNIYEAKTVFTPSSSPTINRVSRPNIEKDFKNIIESTGTQMLVIGDTGTGKTSLVENCLKDEGIRSIKSTCNSEMTIQHLLDDAAHNLEIWHDDTKEEAVAGAVDAKIKVKALGAEFDGGINHDQEMKTIKKRVLADGVTVNILGRALAASKCIWVIDDLHKLQPSIRNELSNNLKVFVDYAKDNNPMRLILIGKEHDEKGIKLIEINDEMSLRINTVNVSLMESNELSELVINGAELLNIYFSRPAVEEIVRLSNGIVGICQRLCLAVCHVYDIKSTKSERTMFKRQHLAKPRNKACEQLEHRYKDYFEYALKNSPVKAHDTPEAVLRALATRNTLGKPVSGEILYENVKAINEKVSKASVTRFLNFQIELNEDENDSNKQLIKTDDENYEYIDPMYCAFALHYFKDESNELLQESPPRVVRVRNVLKPWYSGLFVDTSKPQNQQRAD